MIKGTLILTSSGKFLTRNNVDQYLPKKITDCKIAYIITASKKVEGDDKYVDDRKKAMDEAGYNYVELDIEGENEDSLRSKLKDFNIILVEGGNTYHLLKCIRDSGFEKVVKELISNGVVYIGSSAGTYVACPTIEMATWSDDIRWNRCGIEEYTAMNLVPFLVKVHYTPKKEPQIRKFAIDLDYELKLLTDDEALLVRDGNVILLGKGDEIILN